MDFHSALYCSHAVVPDKADVMNAILATSQAQNAALGITGCLHREHDVFVQYLEGPEAALRATLGRIGMDRRHRKFHILALGPAQTRLLPEWQMGVFAPPALKLNGKLDVDIRQMELSNMDPLEIAAILAQNAPALRQRLEEA